jgi:hypothetical protein
MNGRIVGLGLAFGIERAAEHASGGTGFGHDDFDEKWEARFEAGPDPHGDLFAGGIFETRHFVEIAMVELFPEGSEGGGQIGIIGEPAEFGITGAGDGDFDLEAVAVEATAFVGGGQFGEEMSCFELEGFA